MISGRFEFLKEAKEFTKSFSVQLKEQEVKKNHFTHSKCRDFLSIRKNYIKSLISTNFFGSELSKIQMDFAITQQTSRNYSKEENWRTRIKVPLRKVQNGLGIRKLYYI